jgi:hypothetical protein
MESDNSTLEEVFHFPFNQNTWALLPEIIHTPHRENQPLGTFKYRDKEDLSVGLWISLWDDPN